VADIFISYSKKDAETARVIAALLEAQGYLVWWDTSLVAGDQFRKVIMKELEAAKAVIVLWTENSVNSDWVQSEAGRAHNDRKLVPLKARLLTYDKIPPPFDNLHATNFDNHEAVLTAVEAQVAKPPAPSVVWKKVRYEALTGFGTIGTTLTIVVYLSGLVTLAPWMHFLVEHFTTALHLIWSYLGSLIGIKVPAGLSKILSFFSFWLSLIIGTVLTSGRRRIQKNVIISIREFPLVVPSIILIIACMINVETEDMLRIILIIIASAMFWVSGRLRDLSDADIVENVLLILTAVITLYMLYKGVIELYGDIPIEFYRDENFVIAFLWMLTLTLPVYLLPPKVLKRRLYYLLGSIVVIFGLSELSKLIETVASHVRTTLAP
jgi:hypothetical protein